MNRQERVGCEAEARLTELMGQINCLTAQVVDVIVDVLGAARRPSAMTPLTRTHMQTYVGGLSACTAARPCLPRRPSLRALVS